MIALFFIVPILAIVIISSNKFLAQVEPYYEKFTPYECGFVGYQAQVREPINVQFFLVAVIFLIFDLEIAILYPLAVALHLTSSYGYWVAIVFIAILAAGLAFEYAKGCLHFSQH